MTHEHSETRRVGDIVADCQCTGRVQCGSGGVVMKKDNKELGLIMWFIYMTFCVIFYGTIGMLTFYLLDNIGIYFEFDLFIKYEKTTTIAVVIVYMILALIFYDKLIFLFRRIFGKI